MHKRIQRQHIGLFALGLWTAISLGACGGTGLSLTGEDHRGEGDIPVGRAKNLRAAGAVVRMRLQGGEIYESVVEPSGVFKFPELPRVAATLTIVPLDPQQSPQEFSLMLGPNENYVANVEMQSVGTSAIVTGILIEFMGSGQPRVDFAVPIKTTVTGSGTNGLKPTIWVDGGCAMLDNGNRLVGIYPGTGVVHAQLLGFESQMAFTVQ